MPDLTADAKLAAQFRRRSPFEQWQLVDVTFPATANVNVDIPHDLLVEDPEDVYYLVVKTNSNTALIYRPTQTLNGPGYIRLKCSAGGGITATLLLFTVPAPAREF